MINVLPESEGNLLLLKAEGKLSDKDYKEVFIPNMEAIIKEHGKVRLLLDMSEDFHGWEIGALWDDARFGFEHRKDFAKLGIVGGPKWVEWGLKLAAVIMSGEIKSFPVNERSEAVAWIKN